MGLVSELLNKFTRRVLLFGVRDSSAGAIPDGSRAPVQLDADGLLKTSVGGTVPLPTGAATAARQDTQTARLDSIIDGLPRELAMGEIATRNMEIAFEGAIINSDPGTKWSTQGIVTYAGTAAILTPPQVLPGVPTTMVANLPTTYTSAASLVGKMIISVINPGPGYDFYVGITSAYSGDPLAVSYVAFRLRAGPAPTYYPIVSIVQKADLGGTTEIPQASWGNTLPEKIDQFQAPTLLKFLVEEDALDFLVARTEVLDFYFGGDRTELDLPNLAVGAPIQRIFAYANATENGVVTSLALANPRLYRMGSSDLLSLFVEGRAAVTIAAGATKPIIALRCKLTRNGFANGARYYPTAIEVHTETRRFDIRVYLGTAAELVTTLTGASFVDVTIKEASGWVEIDRSATDVTLHANAGAYLAAGPIRVESLTTVKIPIADSFPSQKALAIRGDGQQLLLLVTATNAEGISADVTVSGIHISQLL